MKRTGLLIVAVAGLSAATSAQVMYSNLPPTGGTVFSTGSTPRWDTADDLTLGPGFTSGGLVTSFVTGFNLAVAPTGSTVVDLEVIFWNTVNFSAGSGVAVFSNQAADFFLNGIASSSTTAGAYIFNPIDLTGLPGGGVSLTSGTVGFQLKFWDNTGGSRVAAANTTSIFYGAAAPTVGSSLDQYWRDANGDGTITGDEARSFGGGTNLANFVVQLNAVPEPTSMAILGLGALALLRRHRKA